VANQERSRAGRALAVQLLPRPARYRHPECAQAGKWRFVRPAPLAAQLVLGRPPCRRNPAATLEGFERARMGAIGRGVGGRSFSLTLPTGYRIILSALKKALVRQCSAIAQR